MTNRFRKVFIVCRDNKIFSDLTQITVYKYRGHAEGHCKHLHEKAMEEQKMLHNVNKPMPKFKVHGFFLVHEDLFKE